MAPIKKIRPIVQDAYWIAKTLLCAELQIGAQFGKLITSSFALCSAVRPKYFIGRWPVHSTIGSDSSNLEVCCISPKSSAASGTMKMQLQEVEKLSS
ncbi:predicted protein [Botrytis cinerea T4]|uniref:Uncharacterized protein n=1 Tax=Botryotinia fuckeliana (strain T4) TaxID=999810 RepID=G2Y8V7_BOTF4|nr:predicted protein [Botrytis cinerea T4]